MPIIIHYSVKLAFRTSSCTPLGGPAAWLYTLCFVNCSTFTVAFLFASCHSHLVSILPLVESSFWKTSVMFACNVSLVIRTMWLILPADLNNIMCFNRKVQYDSRHEFSQLFTQRVGENLA